MNIVSWKSTRYQSYIHKNKDWDSNHDLLQSEAIEYQSYIHKNKDWDIIIELFKSINYIVPVLYPQE